MFVEIITIGDELLIGQVVDTNSAWMGKALNDAGSEVIKRTSVRDREDEITDAIHQAMHGPASIILMTGGLGPTKDDITKKTLCNYFGAKLVKDKSVLEHVTALLKQNNISMISSNVDQALVPDNCTVIPNKIGTAPITWFEQEEKVLVSMPGVPQEMKAVMSDEVIPRLKDRFEADVILHKTFLVINNPESVLAERLSEWEDELPHQLSLAYLPQQGLIRLRLTARGKDHPFLEMVMLKEVEKLLELLKEDILPEEDASMNELIGKILVQKGKTLVTAERCTGGAVAASIVAVPGCSSYYKGGVVVYSNAMKQQLLGVKDETLLRYGAVSKETVIEMAKGALERMDSDYAIATTGIAGPGGGTAEKPVGMVWMAVATKDKVVTLLQNLNRGREQNILRSRNSLLILLYKTLREE